MINMYLRLAWSYFKIGLFGFGGGYAMLSLIEREIVGGGWISEQGFTDIVAVSQMTPGPIGINSATYIGYVAGTDGAPSMPGWEMVMWGIVGALVCTLVVVAPSFVLVLGADKYISRHRESAFIKGMFAGLRPVVPGLIAAAALLLMNADNFGTSTLQIAVSIAICLAVFAAARLSKLHPIFLIVIAGIIGFLVY